MLRILCSVTCGVFQGSKPRYFLFLECEWSIACIDPECKVLLYTDDKITLKKSNLHVIVKTLSLMLQSCQYSLINDDNKVPPNLIRNTKSILCKQEHNERWR